MIEPYVSIIIPAKDEELSVEQLYGQISKELIKLSVAYEIIRLGDFAFYRNSRLQDYFNLAEQVLDRIKDRVHQDNGNWHARLFYSVESLNKFLERGEEETQEKEPAEVGFSRYYLFNKNNEISRPYLGSLISNGELFVGTHEHWLGSNRPGGPRGRNILIKIIDDLKSKGAEKVVLGCTELPLLIKNKKDVINTINVLAKSTIINVYANQNLFKLENRSLLKWKL